MRFWLRHKAVSLWVSISLGLAAGLAAGVWSAIDATWLQPIPVFAPEKLVSIGQRTRQGDRQTAMTFAEFLDIRRRQTVCQDIAAIGREDGWFLDTPDGLRPANVARVTPNFLAVLGVPPQAGRGFTPDDNRPGVADVAMVSHRFWRTALNGSPDVAGRHVRVSRVMEETQSIQIIGILPRGLAIMTSGREADVLVSLPPSWRVPDPQRGGGAEIEVIGRLLPDVPTARATAELTSVMQVLDREFPPRFPSEGPPLADVAPLHDEWYGNASPLFIPLVSIALLMMVVACANVGGVLLAVVSGRAGEFAVRAALGETPRRTRRAMLLELAPLAVGASIVAAVSGRVVLHLAASALPPSLPRLAEIRFDWRMTGLAVAASCASIVLAGMSALFLTERRRNVASILQSAGRSLITPASLRARRLLIVGQTAALVLVVTAVALTASSHWRLLKQPAGFDVDGVLSIGVVPTRNYFEEPGRYTAFTDGLREAIAGGPPLGKVAVTVDPPLGRGRDYMRVTFPNGRYRAVLSKAVSEDFFSVMRIPILAGREFQRSDRGRCAVVVNAAFAEEYYDGPGRALGQTIVLGGGACAIVGVSGDVRDGPLAERIQPAIYPVLSERLARRQTYLVARPMEPLEEDVVARLRDAIRRFDSTAYVLIEPLSARVRAQAATRRLALIVLTALSGFALVAACLGIAATVAQVSAERQRDLAIRRALGASTLHSLGVVMRVTAVPACLGAMLGLTANVWVSSLLDPLLFETPRVSPALWGSSLAMVVGLSTIASFIPARRILSFDIAEVLRRD